MKIGYLADHFFPRVKRGAELETKFIIDEGRRRGHEIVECEGKYVKDVDCYIVGNCVDNFNAGELLPHLSRKPYIHVEHDLRAPSLPFYKMFASGAVLNIFRSPLHVSLIEKYSGKYKHFLHANCMPPFFRDLKLERKPETEVLYVGDYCKEKGYREMEEWLLGHPECTIWHYGCYDDQTEILTENGWKLFSILSLTEKIATLNQNTQELEYQLPTKHIGYHYKGKMFRQEGIVDLQVTLDHNLWLQRLNGQWCFKNPKNCTKYDRYKRNAIWKGVEKQHFELPLVVNDTRKHQRFPRKILMDDWLEFFGYYITEGSSKRHKRHNKKIDYVTKISQSKNMNPHIYSKIEHCIQKLKYRYYANEEYFTICDKQLWSYLSQFGRSQNKFIPREILQLSSRQLMILYRSMMAGDGDKSETRYCSVSKRLADDFQEITLKIGLASNISIVKFLNKNYQYHVFPSKRKLEPTPNRKQDKRSFVEYDGMVYCVEVPNHVIYIRHNGHPVWCGNSGFEKHHPKMREMGYASYENMAQIYNQFRTLIFLPKFPQACCRIIAEAFLCRVPNVITNGNDGFTSYGWTANDYDKVREILVNGQKTLWDRMEEEFKAVL